MKDPSDIRRSCRLDLSGGLRAIHIIQSPQLLILIVILVLCFFSTSRGDYVDPYPSYTGENLLLEGSSFETGLDGFGYSRKMYFSKHPDDGFTFEPCRFDDRPDYVRHGKRSLEIVNESEDLISIDYHWVPLQPDSFYVISFWAKAEKDSGQPAGNMLITAKIIGKNNDGLYTCPFQQSYQLEEDWQRFVSDTITVSSGELKDDLAYLQFFTGPWYSGLPWDGAARLHGTIWLDGVKLAPAGSGTDYEFPPDEEVELGVWSCDAAGPRTGNLFHDSDREIRAQLVLYSDTFNGPLDIDYCIEDSFGDTIYRDTLSGIDISDGSAEGSIILRSLLPTCWGGGASPAGAGNGGTFGSARVAVNPSIDILGGLKGIFRITFTALDPESGIDLGSEEMLLCVIEPDTSGPDTDSPFGTHVHFTLEATQNGFPTTPDGRHDHVVMTSWPQDYIFGAIRDAGFKWVRDFTFASWAAVQPEEGVWNYCSHSLDYCEAYGLQLMPILGWTAPEWAASGEMGDPFVDWQEPRGLVDPVSWENFVFQAMDTFKYRIPIWEICNEPYFYYSAEQYYDVFLTPAAVAAGQVEGATPLLAGPGGGIPWMAYPEYPEGNFIDSLFNGFSAGEQLDILTEHFYAKKAPPFENGFYENPQTNLKDRVQDYVGDYVGDNSPGTNTVLELWDGESGQVMPTLRSDTRVFAIDYRHEPYKNRKFLDEMSGNIELSCLIASYFVRAYTIELAYGTKRFFQHTFFGKGSPAEAGGQRMLEFDGTPNHAYAALSAMMKQLRGADLDGAYCIEGGLWPDTRTVKSYTFQRPEGPVSVLYDYAEDDSFPTLDVDLNPAYLTALDMMGNEFVLEENGSGGFLLTLSNLPQYIEGDGQVVDFDALTEALEEALNPF